jgi:ABC-2 type transport system permease protein
MILVPEFKGLMANRNILGTLVRRDLRVRYARSALGYLWTVLDPLAMSLIYFIVFTFIFNARRVGNEPYILHLLIGLLAWQWFSQCMTETSRALLQESRLVKSTNLPRELWVVRVVMAKGIEFVFSLPVLICFTAVYAIRGETQLNWTLVYFPVAMVMTFILATGVGLMLAPITVLVTDMARVVRIALRMGFYGTPIIYSVHSAPEALRKVLILNPMTGIMELFRTGFFNTEMNRRAVFIGAAICVVVLLLGVGVFKRFESAVLKEI